MASVEHRQIVVVITRCKDFVAPEPLHANIECSFRELDLNGAVVQVEEGKACAAVQADGCRTSMQFCARSVVRPEPVARRQGTVGNS